MKENRTFLLIVSICSLGAIFLVGSSNYLMDPYDYFQASTFQGINNRKLPMLTQERFDRAIRIMQKKPQAIMLGSSRVRAGYPASYYGQLAGYPAFKVAFAGARFNEIFAYFDHVLLNQPDLKAVFLNLDFFAFSKNLYPISEYSEERLRRTKPLLNDFFKLLLSRTTLWLSLGTFYHNLDPSKFETVDRFHVKIDEGDYLDLGLPMIESSEDFLRAEKKISFDEYSIDPEKVEMFRKIVQTCREKKIDLKVVFGPVNVLYWEFVCQCDRWEDFENLKRELIAIYPIYDFSGFTSLNSEDLFKESSGQYFFELSHFTPYYGKVILDKVYGIEDRCPETGMLLTKENVEDHLKNLRMQRQIWVDQNPEKVAWVKKAMVTKK